MKTPLVLLCSVSMCCAQSILHLAGSTPVAGGYTYYATDFAGDGQCWLERDSTGTGVGDSATGTISFWIDPTGSDTADWRVITTNSRLRVMRQGGADAIQFVGVNTSGTTEIQLDQNTATVSTLNAAGGWSWVGICWNNNTAGACYIYIANASTSWVATDCTTRTDDTGGGASIDWTDSDWIIASVNGGGSLHMPAALCELYVSQTYYDFSNSANRDLFYNSSTHKPAGDLSSVGSPIWYFKNPYDSYLTNSGSGGNMTKYGTTALASATAP